MLCVDAAFDHGNIKNRKHNKRDRSKVERKVVIQEFTED